MNIKRILYTLMVSMLLWAIAPIDIFAETRSIYVGDIITLEVTSQGFSEEDLRQKFKDFEIIEIKNEPDGYLLSIRTFDVGEQTILLGDKELIITVGSTLDDIHRENIFEGDTNVIESGFLFRWRILFYFAAGIFVLIGSFVIAKTIKKRKAKPESFYQLFLRRSAALSAEDDNYFVDLTFYFKEYLESLYQCRIIGKTSVEIVNEIEEIPDLNAILPDIKEWLTECDRLKFTGISVSSEEKQHHYMKLLSLGIAK